MKIDLVDLKILMTIESFASEAKSEIEILEILLLHFHKLRSSELLIAKLGVEPKCCALNLRNSSDATSLYGRMCKLHTGFCFRGTQKSEIDTLGIHYCILSKLRFPDVLIDIVGC